MIMDSNVCSMHSSMCLAMEDIMTTLFTPPGCDWSDDTNSVVEDSVIVMQREQQQQQPPMTAHEVCSLWKKKRKAEKMKLQAMKEELEFQSEVKRTALGIQRSFERKVSGEDSDEERQKASYEKYGSRAEFIQNRRK